MKIKVFVAALLVLVGCALGINLMSAKADDPEPPPAGFVTYIEDGFPGQQMIVAQGAWKLPYNWFPPYALTGGTAKLQFAIPVDGGYLVYRSELVAIWWLTPDCQPIWRLPCPSGTPPFQHSIEHPDWFPAFQVTGTVKFQTTFPAYYALVPYETVNLIVTKAPDQGPSNLICKAPAESTYQNCLQVAK